MTESIAIDPFCHPYFALRLERWKDLQRRPPAKVLLGYEVIDEPLKDRIMIVRRPDDSQLLVLKLFFHPRNEGRSELLEEARSMLALDECSQLVRLESVEVESATGRVALLTPYCPGGSLRERQTAGQLAHAEAFHHLLSVLCGLTAIHNKGAVHGDIKPENVLFDYDAKYNCWSTVVCDLGLSTLLRGQPLKGFTRMYAAPEVFQQVTAAPSQDIWSWGIMAWELLTGRHPLTDLEFGETVDSKEEFAAAIGVSIQIRRNEIRSDWLGKVIARCTAMAPDERPSALELLIHFERHVAFDLRPISMHIGGPTTGASFVFETSTAPREIHRYWRSSGEGSTASIRFGVLAKCHKAERLSKVQSQRAHIDALKLVDDVLGVVSDSDSLAARLIQFPHLRAIPIPNVGPTVVEGNTVRAEIDHAHRDMLIQCLSTGMKTFVDVIEKHKLLTPQLLSTAQGWERLCTAIRNELPPWAICLAGQIKMFLGEFSEAESFLEQALGAEGAHQLAAAAARHEFLFATGRVPEAADLAQHYARVFANHGDERSANNWRMRACADLLYWGEDIETVVDLYKLLPQQFDMAAIIRLVVGKRAKLPQEYEIWNALQGTLYKVGTPQRTWLALECVWTYGDHDLARKMAESQLCGQALQLPFYRQYRLDLEGLVRGTPLFAMHNPVWVSENQRGRKIGLLHRTIRLFKAGCRSVSGFISGE